MHAPTKQIVIAGYFGFGSAGDEAILASLCDIFRGAAQPFRLATISGNCDQTSAAHNVEACGWSDAAAISEMVRLADAVVIAGSSLFDPSAAAIVTAGVATTRPAFLVPALLSAIHHKPLVLYGIGLDGPVPEVMRQSLLAVCRAAVLITVSDQITHDLLASLGIATSKISVTADAVWLWEPRTLTRVTPLRKPSLGIALAAEHLPIAEADLRTVLDQYVEETGGSIIFAQLRLWPHPDGVPIAERLRRSVARPHCMFCVDTTSPESLLDGLAACDALIADHRHAAVFGLLARKPVLMIGCSPGTLELRNHGLDRMILDGCIVGVGQLLPKLRELGANAGWGEIAESAVQRMRKRSMASATLLLEALAQQAPWEATGCAELLALGLGLEPGVASVEPPTRCARRLAMGNRQLRQRNQELAAELERKLGGAPANGTGLKYEARAAESEFARAALTERNGALSAAIEGLQRQVQEAERLRTDIVVALDSYQAQLDAELRLFRRQRAWRVMLYLRKAYTVLFRRSQGGRFPSVSALMSLVFAPSKNLDVYDLRFPVLKHALPAGLQDAFNLPAVQYADTPSRPTPTAASRQRRLPDRPHQQAYDVLILPVFEFDFRFQRPQQLAARFARAGHRVFWISPSRTASPDQPYEAVPLQPGLWEIHLRTQLPNIYLSELESKNVQDAIGCIESLYRDFAVAESCTLVMLPFWRRLGLGLRDAFDTKLLYDCMDDWQTMPDISAFNRREEPRLAAEADVLIVTGQGLVERQRGAGREPVLVRNAADFKLFSSARGRGYLEGIPRPIVGYFGAIADWFDYDLLYEVAQSRPHYSFVLIGAFGLEQEPTHREAMRLAELPNIHLLGHKPYAEIPSYLAEFDVCTIPFVLNEVTKATDPVKLYEYLSQGKPVVATPMRELQECGDLIYIAATAAEFASSLDAGLAEQGDELRQRRIHFAANQRWVDRWLVMDEVIRKAFPLVSILIVTYNSAEYVPLCMEALLRNTSYPSFEVIVVDNASRDHTAVLLDDFAGRDPRVRLIRNDQNVGFAAANNLAAGMARGEYVVLLNIDTIPSPGWIGRLVRHCVKQTDIGLIVPVTNNIGNEAKIRVPYTDLAGMEQFAITLGADRLGESLDLAVGPLFCALLPRAVWNRVGPLDERFRVGMFEDDDFSLRIRKAGFRVVAAEDCFVHHFGQGSFAKLAPAHYEEVFATNRRLFEEKWQTEWEPHKYRPGISAEEGLFQPSDFGASTLAVTST